MFHKAFHLVTYAQPYHVTACVVKPRAAAAMRSLDLMNKMLWYLINLRWNLIKYIQFDGFINDVMFYFYLVAVMVGITGLTGFSYFRKMMSYVFWGTMLS